MTVSQLVVQSPPVNTKIKIFYGTGEIATACVAGVVGFLLNPFLLDVAGLTPFMVSYLFIIKLAWDAINDPLMGQLSDRTQSRFGRRKSWLMAASVPLGVCFFLSWMVPDISIWGKFAYYTLMAVLLDTFYTMFAVPYSALTAEMTDDYNQRTSINMYRFSFSLLGSLVATIIFASLIEGAANPQDAYFTAAWIVSLIIIVAGFTPVFFTPEHNPELATQAKRDSLRDTFRSVIAIKPFRQVILLFLFSWTAVQVAQNYLVLYLQYWLQATGNLVLIVVYLQLSAVAFVIFFSWLARKIGKKRVYYVGASAWAIVFGSVFFLQPGQDAYITVVALFGGSGTALALLIPYSMLPDVIDYDEAENGTRREGILYGYFNFMHKIGRGIGLALLSQVLGFAGYQSAVAGVAATTQPELVLLTLRIFVSFIPAGLVVASIAIIYSYPITEDVHRGILQKLAQRKQEPNIPD